MAPTKSHVLRRIHTQTILATQDGSRKASIAHNAASYRADIVTRFMIRLESYSLKSWPRCLLPLGYFQKSTAWGK